MRPDFLAEHFHMNPANILQADVRLSSVVDWNIPLDGTGQGDRGFDVAALLFTATSNPVCGR